MENVVVYSSDTCVYCTDVKNYLKEKGVAYVEKNVSKDMTARKELIKKGFMGVPVVMIGEESIQGFDKNRLDDLLK